MATVDPSCSRPISTRPTTSRHIPRPTRPSRVRATATPRCASARRVAVAASPRSTVPWPLRRRATRTAPISWPTSRPAASVAASRSRPSARRPRTARRPNSHATSEQDGASNDNSPVRIKSAGDDGDVDAGQPVGRLLGGRQLHETTQSVSQDAGSAIWSWARSPARGAGLVRRRWRHRAGRRSVGVEQAERRLVGDLDAVRRLQHQRAGADQEQRRRR